MFNEKCEVLKNILLASNIYEMVLKADKIARQAVPGQFLHIKVNKSSYPLLRRPISINKIDNKASTITLVYHRVGQGTAELSEVQAGELLDVIGPLGKGFPIFEDKKCAVVGGGIGTAPLLELAHNLTNCDAYLGFRNETYKIKDFQDACHKVAVATEDGSVGHKGFVTDLLEKSISDYEVVYTCGPKIMMNKVMELCDKNNIQCYVSIEERMGCGVGACLVCTCKIIGQDGQWHHKRVCKDGPVFNSKEVLFDA